MIQRILHGHFLKVILVVIVRIVARTPLHLKLAKIFAEVLHVAVKLAGSVRVAFDASVVFIVGGVVRAAIGGIGVM